MGVNRTSATMMVKMNAAGPEGPEAKSFANLTYMGHRETARMVAQISDGKKPAAVHNASATSASASTTRLFMRAVAPNGSALPSGLCGTPSFALAGRFLDALSFTRPGMTDHS